METNLASFTDILSDEIPDSQPMSLSSNIDTAQRTQDCNVDHIMTLNRRPLKHTGQFGEFRSIKEIDPKYQEVFTYPFFNLVQSRVIEDALYSDKSIVVCAPTGSGKTVVFEMAIVQLLMEIEDKNYDKDFKIIYMAPVKALCTERLTEWYSKLNKLGLMCIEVTGDTDVDFNNMKPYRVIITTPEKWDMMTRRWRDHRGLVELVKLFLIDEVHILNDDTRGPVLEAVVSRMKSIESSTQSEYRIEQLQRQYQGSEGNFSKAETPPPRIRFVAVSATVSNPEDVASWLGHSDKPAVYYKFGDECRPVKLKKVVEGYPCPDGTSIFKFDIILNYKLWPIIQKYYNGKPTLIFCNTRKSVILTAEALSREITISFNPEQRAKLTTLASTIKNKKLQSLVLAGVGCHHAGLLFEERINIETAFRNRDLPILITTTTLAMGVNLPAHLVIIKNTQQYINGAYQEYSISTVLQMVGRAGRPQFDTEATAVIMTRNNDKPRYESLVCGSEPLQSYLHKRLPENLNSEAALGTVKDVAECVQWLRSTFLYVRAAKDPKRYLGLSNNAPQHLISKKIEELCVRAMNGLASAGLISMDEASCIESTEAGRLMSIFYLDLETMKHIMKIEGTATLEQILGVVCESHELSDMHLRVDERRCLNSLNRNSAAATIRFPMKGKISTRQMKLNCVIQAVLGCLHIPDPSINQEAMKIMRIADRICKCLVAYVTRPDLILSQPDFFSAVLNSLILSKCIAAHLWENSPYVSRQLKGIGPTFSTLLATAGKINFMLLEESHPRDLERIMNKGPPAGNVLRKQISLLPKYKINITPVDQKVVMVELSLLNHNYLAENMENLTAGERHKSYIIAGDSDNHLLLLTSFQDKDLIGMYDGKIIHEIKRKHNFEHKIIIHCVSSRYVGIDAQCEYVFKDLESASMHIDVNSCYFNKDAASNKTIQRQTCITDTYKKRKRKSQCDSSEICKSKEKKKRESALAEKIRVLRESFGKATKDLKGELQKSTEMSNKIIHDILNSNDNISIGMDKKASEQSHIIKQTDKNVKDSYDHACDVNNYSEDLNCESFENNEYMDDTKIDDILRDIESEIYKGDQKADKNDNVESNKSIKIQAKNIFNPPTVKKQINVFKKPKKSNFKFLESLDKNDFHEEEDTNMNETGFSDTIKLQINKYLKETQLCTKPNNIEVETLIGNDNNMVIQDIEDDNKVEPLAHARDGVQEDACEHTEAKLDIESNHLNNSISLLNTSTNRPKEISNMNIITKEKNVISLNQTSSEPDSKLYENNKNIKLYRSSLPVARLYKQKVFSKNADDRNKTNNNNSDGTEFNSKYVRNFKYSAMNIDISTCNEAYQKYHLIKKIKVDIDVTEILSKNDFMPEKRVISANTEHDSTHISFTRPIGDSESCQLLSENMQNSSVFRALVNVPKSDESSLKQRDLVVYCDKQVPKGAKPITYNEENLTPNVDEDVGNRLKYCKTNSKNGQQLNPNSYTDTKYQDNFAANEINNTNFAPKYNENIESHLPKPILAANNEIPEAVTISLLQEGKLEDGLKERKLDENHTNNENTLRNILQKYSQVFRQTKVEDEQVTNDKSPHPNRQIIINAKKVKRPFKITEIDKIEQRLPSLLITETPINSMPLQSKKVEISVENSNNIVNQQKQIIPFTETAQVKERDDTIKRSDDIIKYRDQIIPEEEVEQLSPIPCKGLLISDYKIDDSMFDPKTLLQCLSKDEPEIIPPPPEFRDSNYSPFRAVEHDHSKAVESIFREEELDNSQNIYEDKLHNDFKDFEENFRNNKISFQTDSTKEVETLLLSNDYNKIKPWTISSSPLSRNTPDRSSYTIRQTNLNKFKFLNKEKFKIK